MRSFVISELDNNQRLNRFLAKTVPALGGTLMYKYLRQKRIKVNGKKATADTRLLIGDEVILYINDEFFTKQPVREDYMKASKRIDIVYEDDQIVIMSKEAGILSHSDKGNESDTLVNRFLRYLSEKGEYSSDSSSSFTPALCNRLDRNTSGLVIAAKTPTALREMNLAIRQNDVKKYYLAVTVFKPPKDGIYTAYLRNTNNNLVEVSSSIKEGSKEITTAIRTIYEKNNLYICEIQLISGRKHQIRAHLKHLGCPILGDPAYGDKKKNERLKIFSQVLVSHMISFDFEDNSLYYPTLSHLNKRSFTALGIKEKLISLVDSFS